MLAMPLGASGVSAGGLCCLDWSDDSQQLLVKARSCTSDLAHIIYYYTSRASLAEVRSG